MQRPADAAARPAPKPRSTATATVAIVAAGPLTVNPLGQARPAHGPLARARRGGPVSKT
ncbi:MAG TPA: hypothetical protein VF069_09000 [Streptosporangiaceae bacterium]